MTEKKETKIVQDKQTRATIPQKFVDEHKVTNKDSVEWESDGRRLKGELKKNG